ncbi:MAG TPA: Asp-tRNA(Asn)/Glu-tRNA(Gln) amidotransferase subunit GatC [Candidatus Saccharimonadales bacterium]|jgi:aspartyl-tRNA(Asn)/glutamyl-tRNA(Gln) amidotransferase subunit C
MANLKKDDIRHLAALARITLSPDEEGMFSTQLSSILKYVEQLNAIDTTGLEPTSQVTGLSSVSRSDQEVSDTMSTNELLNQTPSREGDNIMVPKVI